MIRYRTRTETVSVITVADDNEVETHNVHLPMGVVKRYIATGFDADYEDVTAAAVRWFAGLADDHEVTIYDDVTFANVRRYRVEFVVVDDRI